MNIPDFLAGAIAANMLAFSAIAYRADGATWHGMRRLGVLQVLYISGYVVVMALKGLHGQ